MKRAKFEIKEAKNGQSYFVLKANNNKVIATSEMYKTKQACEKGVKAVMDAVFDIIYGPSI